MRLAHMDVHEGLTDRWDSISGGWGGDNTNQWRWEERGKKKKKAWEEVSQASEGINMV